MPRTDELNSLLNEATSGMMAALSMYRRRAATVPLYIQCALKLAAFSIELGQNVYASQLLCAAYGDGVANSVVDETAIGDDLFSAEDIVLLATATALLYKDMKMNRKHAFFLREAVQLCHRHTHAYRKAHALLQISAPAYQVRLPTAGINQYLCPEPRLLMTSRYPNRIRFTSCRERQNATYSLCTNLAK